MVLSQPRCRAREYWLWSCWITTFQYVAPSITLSLLTTVTSATGNMPGGANLRRGRSLLARDEDVQESGLSLFKRGTTLRRKRPATQAGPTPSGRTILTADENDKGWKCFKNIAPGPKDAWMIYCYILTACVPPVLLRTFGEFLGSLL
jgi:hypothetical protein